MKPSPTPWKVKPGLSTDKLGYILDAEGKQVGSAMPRSDAEDIVRAVNSFVALVAQLESDKAAFENLLDNLEDKLHPVYWKTIHAICEGSRADIEAALAAAKKGE